MVKEIEGNEGDSLLDIAHEHDIDLEGADTGWWSLVLQITAMQALAKDP